jgi:D-arabinose 1-dehydrogenase-like Zn-dependent alcohol dehydrogenase
MSRAEKFDHYGDRSVLYLAEVEVPSPSADESVGAKVEGSGDASTTQVLSEMAELVASGQIEIPIAATYPLEQVQDAFAELEKRHTRGRIVLIP